MYSGASYGTATRLSDPSTGLVETHRTGRAVLGCTTLAPTTNENSVTTVQRHEGIEVGAVTSTAQSYRKPLRKTFGTRSVNRVADITVGAADGPQLTFGAVRTIAVAESVRGRFTSRGDVDLVAANIVNFPSEQASEELKPLLDALNSSDDQLVEAVLERAGSDGIEIPGLGTVYAGSPPQATHGPRGALASAAGIRVVLADGRGSIQIGRAWARIQTAVPAGVFSGSAHSLQGSLLDGTVSLGRNPLEILPCRGTGGQWTAERLPGLDVAGQVGASGLEAAAYGRSYADGSGVARTRATVAKVVLGGGALVVEGVVGQVNVVQDSRGRIARRTVGGTRIGKITADGRTYSAPAPGQTLEIPGVARLTAGRRTLLGKRGVAVVALQVRLLGDSAGESVVSLGSARAYIRR